MSSGSHGGLRRLLLLPLQFAVLVTLHLLFASYRLAVVITHLTAFLPRSPSPPPPTAVSATTNVHSIRRDQQQERWSKTPRHIAVVFVPSARSPFPLAAWTPYLPADGRGELVELAKLVKDVRELLGWCETLGVQSLSVYDEEGVLERNAELVRAALSSLVSDKVKAQTKSLGRSSFRVIVPQSTRSGVMEGEQEIKERGREMDSGCGASEFDGSLEVDGTASTSTTLVPSSVDEVPHRGRTESHRSPMTLNLLSRSSGRPHLASVARSLATSIQRGEIASQSIDAGFIQESIEASGVHDPDLMIVLGGPYLRLRGFPPWQLRLTEMYHHSWPSWLPAPPITYSILRSALDVYGGAEMRLGR